ncbi:hypothetical protein K432DRAFT_144607 [Lepidopterella palustris CBS 459.81]|uniref:Uncharacterized protein n=1 Tax=Lepidopterella palustris CBS 459.81 TaxID=1314670 RepID=A0A8E2JIX6_9PEZI|nr:hypothetical protein K432DRAFT_144607 [Lepidopterella palustris CBS 459.81]
MHYLCTTHPSPLSAPLSSDIPREACHHAPKWSPLLAESIVVRRVTRSQISLCQATCLVRILLESIVSPECAVEMTTAAVGYGVGQTSLSDRLCAPALWPGARGRYTAWFGATAVRKVLVDAGRIAELGIKLGMELGIHRAKSFIWRLGNIFRARRIDVQSFRATAGPANYRRGCKSLTLRQSDGTVE